MTNKLAITLSIFTTITTNWHGDTWQSSTLMWPPEANITTYHERGTINSNVFGSFTWEGIPCIAQLLSVPIGHASRSYTLKEVKEYTEPVGTITGPPIVWTNGSTWITNLCTNVTTRWIFATNRNDIRLEIRDEN